jgi:Rod binding domain-containing protein
LLDQELAKELSSKGGIGLTSLMRCQRATFGTTTQSVQDHQKKTDEKILKSLDFLPIK